VPPHVRPGPGPPYTRHEEKPSIAAYCDFDVEIHDAERCQDFMRQMKPALDAAGARVLACVEGL